MAASENTPESVRELYGLPTDMLTDMALIEVAYSDARIRDFHKKAGIVVVAAVHETYHDYRQAYRFATFTHMSAYAIAYSTLAQKEKDELVPFGTTVEVNRHLLAATFDESEWAAYLPAQDLPDTQE